MAKTKNNVQMPSDIRNRLMAAVAMLMIACIMLVTTTYAWFTLSTAPEVTNINTQVTGNGSLEIALMPTTGLVEYINKGKGTSSTVADIDFANRSWGNLVSLTSTEYGLADIILMPALIASGDDLSKDNILNTATYGQDGRIVRINGTTTTASYNAEDGEFTEEEIGVRAIGESGTGVTLDRFSTFGYVIDLALRTNTTATNTADDGTVTTANAKLLMQTAGTQRIYGDSTDVETLGAGTTFTVAGSADEELLQAIRFTFVENLGNENENSDIKVLGTASLKTKEVTEDNVTKIVVDKTNTGVCQLVLYNDVTTTTTDDNGVETTTTTKTEATKINNNYVLTDLTENEAKQISVIVWLDGRSVSSADFATDGTSLNGTLNLQFSTDVTLEPAANTALKNTAN